MEGILVRKIKDGTVIDHIPAGMAFTVLRILGLVRSPESRLAVIVNTDSGKYGRKDIIKIENKYIEGDLLNKIALIAPHATINIIKDYEIVEKYRVDLPDKIENVVRCSNPVCITNSDREAVTPSFNVVSKEPVRLKCTYCGRYTEFDDIIKQFTEK